MNNKNTENRNPETRMLLLQAGIELFSRHGYEATTTRMVAEAVGSNNAAVFFYFDSKENFYKEVLNYVAESMKETYRPLSMQVYEARKGGPLSPARAWIFIQQYIDLYIEILKNPEYSKVMYLLVHEQLNPVNGHRPLTAVACRDGENLLKSLLEEYWQIPNHEDSSILSRLSTSALVALAEHPQFIRLSLGIPENEELPETVWQRIRSCILTMLHDYVPDAETKCP